MIDKLARVSGRAQNACTIGLKYGSSHLKKRTKPNEVELHASENPSLRIDAISGPARRMIIKPLTEDWEYTTGKETTTKIHLFIVIV